MNATTDQRSGLMPYQALAECYATRTAMIRAIAEQALDGRIWQEFGRADAQQALATILEIAVFPVGGTS